MLLDPFTAGVLGPLKNRVVMTAMTRGFAGPGHTATAEMAQYYSRRAQDGVGLILTEGVIVHPRGDGYNNVPYIETAAQAESWLPVLNSVHEYNTKIVCQLWYCGRISHEDYTNGLPPLSSSSIQAEGINRQNNKPYGIPIAMTQTDINEVYEQFTNAAKNAVNVGFDAVQLHCGHGYICDQFFDDRINNRTDAYGGSIANRCRFTLELIQRVSEEIGPDKIIVRISPSRMMKEMIYDWNQLDGLVSFFIENLDKLGITLLDVSCANADYFQTSGRVIRKMRKAWPHLIMGGASLAPEQAQNEITAGYLDLVTWGRYILANPDFVSRITSGKPLEPFNIEMLKQLN